jgi:hypothetical protein
MSGKKITGEDVTVINNYSRDRSDSSSDQGEIIKSEHTLARYRPNTTRDSMRFLNLTKDLKLVNATGDFRTDADVKEAMKLA